MKYVRYELDFLTEKYRQNKITRCPVGYQMRYETCADKIVSKQFKLTDNEKIKASGTDDSRWIYCRTKRENGLNDFQLGRRVE